MKRRFAVSMGVIAALLLVGFVRAADTVSSDIIARVGDQRISFTQIEVTLNSMPIQGLSIPPAGSPERQNIRMVMLDKLISANLLYLDALRLGKDKDPDYLRELEAFSDGVLAGLYKSRYLIGDIPVLPQEVKDFFDNYVEPGTEFTEQVKLGIEASIRRQRFKQLVKDSRKTLRAGIKVSINMTEIDPPADQIRKESDVVATIEFPDALRQVTWSEVSARLTKPQNGETTRRIEALDSYIDTLIMVKKARQAGLENDPVYKARLGEYRKTRLVVRHKQDLHGEWMPDKAGLEAYYKENQDRFATSEMRKVQMVVLKTKEEAADVRHKIESGEITMYEAASEYSIVPGAKMDLGEIGWVAKGSGFPELDKLTFSLGPDELGGPVESPSGWHVIKVLDQQDAQHTDIGNENTQTLVRHRYLQEKQDAYVVTLRKERFTVDIDEDNLNRLLAVEAERLRDSDALPEKPRLVIEKAAGN